MAFSSAIKTSLLCGASGAVEDPVGDSFLLALIEPPWSGFRGEDAMSVAWDDSSIIDTGTCSELFTVGSLGS